MEHKVSVVVTTYNQEKYIAECLEGIFAQRGDFSVEVVMADDCSKDRTFEIIKDYAAAFGGDRFDVKILAADHNLGMTKNLQRALAACTGDYIAICEGDDYWSDPEKLHKQLEFLKSHPGCVLCFHDFYMYLQEEGKSALFDLQQELQAEIITTQELILNNYIGNFSCCMYDARVMKKIPSGLFDLPMADWMFNIYLSQFGEIGHLKETLSVYRKHTEGLWTGRELETREVQLHGFIEEYNKFLNYDFDPEFSVVQKRIVNTSPDKFKKKPSEIAVIDDAFPHPLSAFRLQELTSYLKEFEDLKIFCTGEALPWLGDKTLDDLFREFKRAYPEFAPKIERLTPGTMIHTKSLYFIFLGTAYRHVDLAEQLGVPFVFTLYPGSVFGIHNEKSDAMLERLTSSPCFRKVIVTQKITYDYLIKKGFCRPEQIEFIFGVVTPLEQMEADYAKEKRFGIDKNSLDICFVAHKYAPSGIDKGYDVFVEVARRLCETYQNIRFHVVGGFDPDVIDVTDLKERITFYGRRDMEWFDKFYKDKDIILSPNVPFMNPQVPGSFDGFPTATCVDAGLRKTAIFCTDELGLNTQFADREELVIIPHDAGQVTSILEYYYQHPEQLKNIAEKGSRRIKQLYSYEAQILPRINLLRQEIQRAGQSQEEIRHTLNVRRKKSKRSEATFGLLAGLKKRTPAWLMNLLRRGMHTLRSRKRLLVLLKRVLPAPLLRFLTRLRDSA
jgi:glycosyltransferase involved in cell wall biosynthesis